MSTEVVIRPFRPRDQPAAQELILCGLADHFGRLDRNLNPDLADIAATYTAGGHLFLVAVGGTGELVGTAALLLEPGGSGRIVRVSVAAGWRRRGIARALVSHLLEAARRAGLSRVWAETNDDWIAAIALYQACGFVATDRRDGSVYLSRELARNSARADA